MKVYTLKPESLQRETRKLLKRGVFISLLISTAAFAASLFALARQSDQGDSTDGPVPVLSAFVLIGGCMLYGAIRGIRRSLRRLKDAWDSYELGLGVDFVLRKQANLPDVEIGREEITRIQEASFKGFQKGLVIRTADRHRFISIPADLDGYVAAKHQLEQWRLIEPLSTSKHLALQILVWLLMPAAFLVILVSNNEWLVLTVGILLIAFLVFTLIELRRSMNIDSTGKNLQVMVLMTIAVIVIVAVRVYAMVAHLEKQ